METESTLKNIGTHSGLFHADEVLACCMLRKFTKDFCGGKVTRSRDVDVWQKMDILVDVGGVYDQKSHRYDHHQREFQDTWSSEHKIRLSSAGLIYRHFGREIFKNAYNELLKRYKLTINDFPITNEETWELLYQKLYEAFIKSVDGRDNGINAYDGNIKPLYGDNTGFGDRIARMNPFAFEKDAVPDERFELAMDIAENELLEQIKDLTLRWLPGRQVVETAIKERFTVHSSGKILRFDSAVAWKGHVLEIEQRLDIVGELLFVLFKNGPTEWRVQGVPLAKESFDLRNPLKKEWCGIQNIEKLREVSGIPDIVFCHANGFIGGANSYESAMRMALESMK